jgi:predicted ATPase
MIQKISIKNFKSVHNNEMELGRFNVLIGENGSGKSNILEAIAFGGAASANMLNNEFLASRGIRVTTPELMKSGFNLRQKKIIELNFDTEADSIFCAVEHHKSEGWVELERNVFKLQIEIYGQLAKMKDADRYEVGNDIGDRDFKKIISKFKKDVNKIPSKEKNRDIFIDSLFDKAKSESDVLIGVKYSYFSKFLIYSPENSTLRNFFDEGQIIPLGIRGEGLFSLLKEISKEKRGSRFKKIIESLKIIDWFDGLELEATGFPGEKGIKIKDKYISSSIQYIDQRSTNEGFLFLLFYITLFVSDKTPDFFAIDNIEASFNPKLCIKLIQVLAKLAKEHKKQVIVTTHNPFILDGLNLADDDQRLFVVRRNVEGHTITNRVQPKEKLTVPLSEAWMRGYIGGLPNNF